jgi:hypothetical protein
MEVAFQSSMSSAPAPDTISKQPSNEQQTSTEQQQYTLHQGGTRQDMDPGWTWLQAVQASCPGGNLLVHFLSLHLPTEV